MERFICGLMNNLAYYTAKKKQIFNSVSSEDRHIVKECIKYIQIRLLKYPEYASDWADTIETVIIQFPDLAS